jgi:heavy metal sensor kinase
VTTWWNSRSLKLRLTVWYTAVVSGTLLAMALVAFGLIEHRLHMDLDRQLRADWTRIKAHLEFDRAGRIQWQTKDVEWAGLGQAAACFEVWSEDSELLLRRWPIAEEISGRQQLPAQLRGETFHTFRLGSGQRVRAVARQAQIAGRSVILRVFRDESPLRSTSREILVGFALAIPVAGSLAAVGGYLTAGRILAPVSAMVARARQITSESLDQRLPNPNPHDELGQLAAVFNQTLQRLQDSFESLRRFTADASHELRTPLTALCTVGEVGLREDIDAKALREIIGSMLEEAQRLNDLIDSLLLLARFDDGRSPLRFEPVDLNELLSELRERLGVLAAEKQQTLKLADRPGLVATTDRTLLRQALANILHNAIRYSPPGTTVSMCCQRRDHTVMVDVADEGPGIAPEHHQKIFERFYRVDKARSRAEGGAGLGLAIAKLFVEQHGGSIELESAVGKGSRFRIVLPSSRSDMRIQSP